MSSSDDNNTASPSPADEAGKFIGAIFVLAFWILCATSPIFIARLLRWCFSTSSPSPWDHRYLGCTTFFGGLIYVITSVVMIDYADRHELSFSRAAMVFACIASFYVVVQFMILVTVGACLDLKRRYQRSTTRGVEVEDGIRMEARKRDDGVARVS